MGERRFSTKNRFVSFLLAIAMVLTLLPIGAVQAKAEEAAQKANEWKEHAYQHDSGSQSSYCMYERAAHLMGILSTHSVQALGEQQAINIQHY